MAEEEIRSAPDQERARADRGQARAGGGEDERTEGGAGAQKVKKINYYEVLGVEKDADGESCRMHVLFAEGNVQVR